MFKSALKMRRAICIILVVLMVASLAAVGMASIF